MATKMMENWPKSQPHYLVYDLVMICFWILYTDRGSADVLCVVVGQSEEPLHNAYSRKSMNLNKLQQQQQRRRRQQRRQL